jgi:hypothetical protein
LDHHRDRFARDVRLDRFVDRSADQRLGERPVYMDYVVVRCILPARNADRPAIPVLRVIEDDRYGPGRSAKNKAKGRDLTKDEKKELTAEEKEYKSKRKLVQEKLIKFATRIAAFMYLTDFRENTLRDVITKLEPDLFLTVTGLTVKDFHLLVSLRVFNTEQMNQAVFAFRRYEDSSLRYTGIESHEGLTRYGLYDTVVARV